MAGVKRTVDFGIGSFFLEILFLVAVILAGELIAFAAIFLERATVAFVLVWSVLVIIATAISAVVCQLLLRRENFLLAKIADGLCERVGVDRLACG